MNKFKCLFPGCEQPSTMHITRAEGRTNIEETHLCDLHGRSHFEEYHDRYYALSRIGPGSPLATGHGVAFEIDFLYCDELQMQPWGRWYVGLIEVGGCRRMGFEVGSCEGSSLDRELKHYHSPRPLTHRAMASIIEAVGGRLQFILIDKYHPSQGIFEAKLHIQQMDATLAVDVRPSDAAVLAVISEAPIIVSNDVLATLAGMR